MPPPRVSPPAPTPRQVPTGRNRRPPLIAWNRWPFSVPPPIVAVPLAWSMRTELSQAQVDEQAPGRGEAGVAVPAAPGHRPDAVPAGPVDAGDDVMLVGADGDGHRADAVVAAVGRRAGRVVSLVAGDQQPALQLAAQLAQRGAASRVPHGGRGRGTPSAARPRPARPASPVPARAASPAAALPPRRKSRRSTLSIPFPPPAKPVPPANPVPLTTPAGMTAPAA